MKWATLWITTLRGGLLTGGKVCFGLRTGAILRCGHVMPFAHENAGISTGRGSAPERRPNLPVMGPPKPPERPHSVEKPPMSRARAPRRASSRPSPARGASVAISSVTDCPFIATRAPVGATSGIDQSSSRPSGATAREVTTSKVRCAVQGLGPAAHDLDVGEPEVVDDLGQEGGPPQQRLDQGDPAGPGGRSPAPGPGRPAPLPMSQTVLPSGIGVAQHRAVQQVPLPQPRHLPRADQAAHHARVGQGRGVRLDQRQPGRREHPPRHVRGDRGCGGCFT